MDIFKEEGIVSSITTYGIVQNIKKIDDARIMKVLKVKWIEDELFVDHRRHG